MLRYRYYAKVLSVGTKYIGNGYCFADIELL